MVIATVVESGREIVHLDQTNFPVAQHLKIHSSARHHGKGVRRARLPRGRRRQRPAGVRSAEQKLAKRSHFPKPAPRIPHTAKK